MSTNHAAGSTGKGFASLPATPAPAAPAKAAAQPAAKAAAKPAATGQHGNQAAKPAGTKASSANGSAAARNTEHASATARSGQPGAAPTGTAAQAPDARGGAAPSATMPEARSTARAPEAAVPPLFAQLIDLAALQPADAGTEQDPALEQEAQATADGADSPESLAALLPSFAVLPLPTGSGTQQGDASGQRAAAEDAATAPVAGQAGTLSGAAFASLRGIAALQASQTADAARQAAANAMTAGAAAQASADALSAQRSAPAIPAAADSSANGGNAAAASSAGQSAGALAADTPGARAGAKSIDPGIAGSAEASGFRTVMAATSAAPAAAGDTVRLAGTPEQWQQPLRAALGDRLQLQLQRNSEHAVIRLDPPNMGSIEISIRHSAGALQVSLSASNNEVLRQLNHIGDSMRQDLSQRQFTEVAVTVSAGAGRNLADGSGGGTRQERQQQERGPGLALNEGDDAPATFALNERE